MRPLNLIQAGLNRLGPETRAGVSDFLLTESYSDDSTTEAWVEIRSLAYRDKPIFEWMDMISEGDKIISMDVAGKATFMTVAKADWFATIPKAADLERFLKYIAII